LRRIHDLNVHIEAIRQSFLKSDEALALLSAVRYGLQDPMDVNSEEWPAEKRLLEDFVKNHFPDFIVARLARSSDADRLWGTTERTSAGRPPLCKINMSFAAAFELSSQRQGPHPERFGWVQLAVSHTVNHELAHALQQYFFGTSPSPREGWLLGVLYFGYVALGVWSRTNPTGGPTDFVNLERWVAMDLNTGFYHDFCESATYILQHLSRVQRHLTWNCSWTVPYGCSGEHACLPI
jgi:hypothetical protein